MAISYTNFVGTGQVTTNAQPNITSVGTLTGLTVNGTSNLGNVGNVKIFGGSNNYTLQTDGNGNLTWKITTETFFSDFDVRENGLPVYANSTAQRSIPLIYIGNDPGANYIWPFYQNTSTTANGYVANSTAAWTPDNAAILQGNWNANTLPGDWYELTNVVFIPITDANNQVMNQTITVYAYGNTANVAFQLVPFIGYSYSNTVYLQTEKISTCYTNNAVPQSVGCTLINVYKPFIYQFGNLDYDLAGYYIRNITANTELTVYATCHRLELNT